MKLHSLKLLSAFRGLSRNFSITFEHEYAANNGVEPICLVGLNGVVVKSHGGADEQGFVCALEVAVHEAQRNVPALIGAALLSSEMNSGE